MLTQLIKYSIIIIMHYHIMHFSFEPARDDLQWIQHIVFDPNNPPQAMNLPWSRFSYRSATHKNM